MNSNPNNQFDATNSPKYIIIHTQMPYLKLSFLQQLNSVIPTIHSAMWSAKEQMHDEFANLASS